MKKASLSFSIFAFTTLLFNCGNTETPQSERQKIVSDNLKQDKNGLILLPSDIITKSPLKAIPIQNIASINYIKLESGDDHLVSFPYALGITQEYIFMPQGTRILRFGKDGKFKNKIGQPGHGPNEYTHITAVAFNDKTQETYIADSKLKIIFIYDYDNNFIKKIPYDWQNSLIEAMKVIDDTTLLISRSAELMHLHNYGQFQLLSLSTGKVTNLMGKYEKPKIAVGRLIIEHNTLSCAADGYLMYGLSSDTVYCYNTTKRKIYPKYILNPTTKDKDSEQECYINTIYENSSFIKVYYRKEDLSVGSYYLDKKTGEKSQHLFSDANITGDNGNYRIAFIETDSYDLYYSSLDALKLCEFYETETLTGKLKEIAKTLKEDDNPVIILATLKN